MPPPYTKAAQERGAETGAIPALYLLVYKYTKKSGGGGGTAHEWASIVFVWMLCFKIRANISSHLGVRRAGFFFFYYYQALPAGPRH